MNENVFSLSPQSVGHNLVAANPGVREVRLSVGWPNRVTLNVKERVPILAWQQGGVGYWVDAEGVFFPVLAERGGSGRWKCGRRARNSAHLRAFDVVRRSSCCARTEWRCSSGTAGLRCRPWTGDDGSGRLDGVFRQFGHDRPEAGCLPPCDQRDTRSGCYPGMVSVEDMRQPFYRG